MSVFANAQILLSEAGGFDPVILIPVCVAVMVYAIYRIYSAGT